jgi:hypothetical protein
LRAWEAGAIIAVMPCGDGIKERTIEIPDHVPAITPQLDPIAARIKDTPPRENDNPVGPKLEKGCFLGLNGLAEARPRAVRHRAKCRVGRFRMDDPFGDQPLPDIRRAPLDLRRLDIDIHDDL